jgi:hypothetical protein
MIVPLKVDLLKTINTFNIFDEEMIFEETDSLHKRINGKANRMKDLEVL